jgi:hypothetical protein
MSRSEWPFVLADDGFVDRTPAVLRIGFIEAATTMVLHVGCPGRPGHGSAKLSARECWGEGPHNAVSTTRDV